MVARPAGMKYEFGGGVGLNVVLASQKRMSGYRMVLATAKGGAKLCYIAFGFRTDGLEEAQKSFQA